MNATTRLRKALERPESPVPFSVIVSLPDARELLELAEQAEAQKDQP